MDLIKVAKDGTIGVIDYLSADALEKAKEILIKEKSTKKAKYLPTIDEIIDKSKELTEDFKNNRFFYVKIYYLSLYKFI